MEKTNIGNEKKISICDFKKENSLLDVDEDENLIECTGLCNHKGDLEKEIDELLESIWELNEQGKITENHYKECGKGQVVLQYLKFLCKRNFIVIQDSHIKFTKAGRERARNIVRRHRLTERMLTDLFDIPEGRIESTSCEFEHILSEEVTDSICTFLGHPTTCPHGHPIPRGECCSKLVRSIRPLVMQLTELIPGEKGVIKFISSKDKRRMQKLSSLGIIPGSIVTVIQKLPDIVIQVNQTEIAMDRGFVMDIYVKRVNTQ